MKAIIVGDTIVTRQVGFVKVRYPRHPYAYFCAIRLSEMVFGLYKPF